MTLSIMILAGCASLLPAVIGIFRFKRLGRAMKAYALLCVLSSLWIATEFALALYHRSGIIVSNIALGVETMCIVAVYTIAVENKYIRMVMLLLVVVFTAAWIPGIIIIHNPGQFNEEMAIASRSVILASSLMALFVVARKTAVSLTDEPLFWVTSGNILYACGLIFLLSVSNDLLEIGAPYYTAAWDANWLVIIITDVLFAKGLLCRDTSQT